MKRIAVFTGAGISAESGIKTFRDADGLWEGHDVMEVATPEGWRKNRDLVLDFYNQRRKQLLEVMPNEAHLAITKLQKHFRVDVITQNVDDLHERAGNSNVLHLHGELLKVRSEINESEILEWAKDLTINDRCSQGSQLRPHIVWFGEAVPMMEEAVQVVSQSDLLIIVGTSLQVYPAASLIEYAPAAVQIYYIDPRPSLPGYWENQERVRVIAQNAGIGLPSLVREILGNMLIK